MWPFEIYRAALYNVLWWFACDGHTIQKNNIYIYIRIASVCLVYVGLAQARSNKNSDFLVVMIWMGLTHACPNDITQIFLWVCLAVNRGVCIMTFYVQ